MRPSVLVSVLVILFLLPAAGCGRRGEAEDERRPIYSFDARADRLLREMFPTSIACSGVTNAYAARDTPPAFKDLSEVFAHHSRGINRAPQALQAIEISDDYLESYWLTLDEANGRAKELLQRAGRIESLARSLCESPLRFPTPLEKALFQRDVFQMCLVFVKAVEAASDAKSRSRAVEALRALAVLWRAVWFRDEEFRALAALRPTRVDETRFTTASSFNLHSAYLPQRVLSEEAGWYEVPFDSTPASHFVDFEGRSFIRVFIKPPGMSHAAFRSYRDRMVREYGTRLVLTGKVPPLPAKTETLLVRTFGIFLWDGTYADSGFPEEVLLRLFKYDRTRLDLATSDFRGTLFYQYKMRRRDLLARTRSLGLRRIRETDAQFFGFLAEVPDAREANSETLTIMRNNCVSCHSEALYGVSTVFSLARRDAGAGKPGVVQGGLLEVVGTNRFRLKTPEFKALQALTK
ncbi:MAG: hypothetical protein HYS12_18780 [Planctomycetes bacterium]|nr:hypothetical protein [Planctomycetota bacterium]